MVTSNHRCKGFMAATITATEMCGLSVTAQLLGCLKRLKIKPIKPGFEALYNAGFAGLKIHRLPSAP